MKKLIQVILLFAFTSNCDQKENIDLNSDGNFLIKTNTLTLPLDERSTFEFYMYQVVSDTLFVLNQVNYSLDYYDLNEGRMLGRIQIEPEGETGIQRLNSFYYHNRDTIFLFPQFTFKRSQIINLDGIYKGNLATKEFQSDLLGMVNHVGTPSMPNIKIGDKIYFSVFPLTEEGINDDYFVHEHSLDILTGEYTSYPSITKPAFLHGNRWVDEIFTRIKPAPQEWYFSWNLSDTIYHIKGDFDTLFSMIPIVINGGINTTPTPLDGSSGEMSEEAQRLNASSFVYGKFFLDTERNLIHRVRYLPLPNPDKVFERSGNPYLEKNFEIITAKIDGTHLGSTFFESGKYDPRLIFLGPEGIYIPKIHPGFSDLSEEKIEYEIYQVK